MMWHGRASLSGMAGSSPRASGTGCALSCRDGPACVAPPLSGAGGGGSEVEGRLRRLWGRRWSEQVGDGAVVHQVCADQGGEGEQAGDDSVGVVGEAQQHERDQRDCNLNANGIFRGSKEVADLQGLLDPSEEQLDRPSPLVEVCDLLRPDRKSTRLN